jgi:hypothetical protein
MKEEIKTIRWVDTTSDSEWKKKEDIMKWAEEETICESTGFLVGKNKKHIVIASMRDKKNNEFSDYHKIPRRCIKRSK